MFLSIIGLTIRHKLDLEYKKISNLKINLKIKPNTHKEEKDSNILKLLLVSKQINDKERYLAAMENPDISKLVSSLLYFDYN